MKRPEIKHPNFSHFRLKSNNPNDGKCLEMEMEIIVYLFENYQNLRKGV